VHKQLIENIIGTTEEGNVETFDFRSVHTDIFKLIARKMGANSLIYSSSYAINRSFSSSAFYYIFAFSCSCGQEDYITFQNNGSRIFWHWYRPLPDGINSLYVQSFEGIEVDKNIFPFCSYRDIESKPMKATFEGIDSQGLLEIDIYGSRLICQALMIIELSLQGKKSFKIHNSSTSEASSGAVRNFSRVSIAPKYLRKLEKKINFPKNSEFSTDLQNARRTLQNKNTRLKQGYVYAVVNPNFTGWIKLGSCVDTNERLASFQTSDPLARYKLEFAEFVEDRREIEHLLHLAFASFRGTGEWFNVSLDRVKEKLKEIIQTKRLQS
jgi:hypothetical protein